MIKKEVFTLQSLITFWLLSQITSLSFYSTRKNINISSQGYKNGFLHESQQFSVSALKSSSRMSKGFGGGAMSRKKKLESPSPKEELSVIEDNLTETEKRGGSEIYSLPALYDLAFGYRNFESEVDFLIYAHQTFSNLDSKVRMLNVTNIE